MPDGLVSTHLVREAKVGTLVHLEQAKGEFVLPTGGGKLLFVTAGSGVTPVIGMLRNLCALDAAGSIRLVARYDDEHGVLDVDDLDALVPDLAERQTLACGPGGLLDALAVHHGARGISLLTEQFRASTLVVGEGGTVAFTRSSAAVEADGATPILDAAEAAGVLMPSGCRMGICFGCVLPLREGAVRDLRTGAVTRATPGETEGRGVPIQTCISAAAGACVIDH